MKITKQEVLIAFLIWLVAVLALLDWGIYECLTTP